MQDDKHIMSELPDTKKKVGLLEGKATMQIEGDFKITDEEFLQS